MAETWGYFARFAALPYAAGLVLTHSVTTLEYTQQTDIKTPLFQQIETIKFPTKKGAFSITIENRGIGPNPPDFGSGRGSPNVQNAPCLGIFPRISRIHARLEVETTRA